MRHPPRSRAATCAGSSTDLGTFPAGIVTDGSYDVGVGQPDMVRDWGRRATHEMTLAARALVARFYGEAPSRAYFAGCSTGGHQALAEAQFFPQDYDGIVAGAPGHNRTHLHAEFTRLFQIVGNPRTNEVFYSAWPFGAEPALRINGAPRSEPGTGRADGVLRWVMGARWDARSFDRDADLERIDAALAPDINALNADLSAYAAHGGKIILYHGWEDPIVSALDTIAYVRRVRRETTRADAFMRLFMAPGVAHCAGGSGPDVFGGQAGSVAREDPEQDLLAALDRWVEKGIAPESIIAARRGVDGTIAMRRPLCAYPRVARYDGRGDPDVAASFSCGPAREAKFDQPAERYSR